MASRPSLASYTWPVGISACSRTRLRTFRIAEESSTIKTSIQCHLFKLLFGQSGLFSAESDQCRLTSASLYLYLTYTRLLKWFLVRDPRASGRPLRIPR